MEKKFEDGELDNLIDEQFIKEAQMMEKALFSDDEDTEAYEASEEEIMASYQELVVRLKKDGVYREDEEESGTAEELEAVNAADKVVPIHKKRRRSYYRLVKAAGFVLVSAMCVFAASMTSEANRDYFVKHVGVLLGEDTRVIVDNDEENEKVNTDEYAAIDDIEKKLGIDVPEFFYRPDTFEYYNYEVNPYAEFARIEYKYKDSIIELGIDKINESTTSKLDSVHGEESTTVNIDREDIDVNIRKVQDTQDELPSYLAQWERENAIYYIFGKINLDELSKIIKLICY